MMPLLRADLHVHTCHSKITGTMRFLGSRDCYSQPADVYRVAKARGMDLVAFTDHDSIDGALELLNDRPDGRDVDVIVGEEVSCRFPDADIEVHLAVYGMTESLHRDLQPLRSNVFDVAARLRDAGVVFALNHLLHFYRGQIPLERYLRILDEVPALEARNGAMLPGQNRLIERLAQQMPAIASSTGRFGVVGGSDAHTLRRVGTTWTEAPGRDRDEFMSSVRSGLGRPGGRDGGALAVSGDAYGVIGCYIAGLAGIARPDHSGWRRAACLAFAVGSLPFQLLPFALVSKGKLRERRKVRALERWMTASLGGDGSAPWARTVEAQR